MIWDILAIILGTLLCIAGFIGGLLPALPGPPLNLAALVLFAGATKCAEPLTITVLLIMTAITVVVAVVDYVLPLMGAKRFGATKWGIWGSIIGMIAGLFFPVFGLGLIIGAFIGAVVGELIGGKTHGQALKAGFGTFIGTVFGLVAKVGASAVMTYYFVCAIFAHYA